MSKIQDLLSNYSDNVDALIVAESAAVKVRELRVKVEGLHKEITDELVRLDVVQRGNFGWENRTVTFLLHLFKSNKKAE